MWVSGKLRIVEIAAAIRRAPQRAKMRRLQNREAHVLNHHLARRPSGPPPVQARTLPAVHVSAVCRTLISQNDRPISLRCYPYLQVLIERFKKGRSAEHRLALAVIAARNADQLGLPHSAALPIKGR